MDLFDIQLFSIPVQPTSANTHDYTATDLENETNFGKLLEPGLRKIFFETYTELPEQYSRIYNVNKSTKAKETDWGMGAFGDWTARADHLDEVAYATLSPGLERTYVHTAFTKGFIVTREMYEDEQYGQMKKMASALARAGRASVEKDAMKPLLDGFTVNGYDGVPLFSANHPLLDSTKKSSNLATGALNDVNLKNALKIMRETLDEAGNLIQLKATRLIIPPALEDTAIRVLGSDRISGGELNDTNAFLKKHGIEVVVMDYLSEAAGGSDTHWFLQDGTRHELNFFWRIKPEFKATEEFDNFAQKYRGYMRYSYGYSDWRGIVGSTGVTSP